MDNGEPVFGASIYIPNTTFGASADANGRFEFTTTLSLPIVLNVSSIGFGTKVVELKVQENLPLNIVIEERMTLLDEVVLTPYSTTWEEFGADFTEAFIGYSGFAKQVQIVNKEDIQLYFNEKTRTLFAKSEKPIIILNKALGYKITYWLESFEKSYSANGMLSFKGYPFFEDLTQKETIGKSQGIKWLKNRNAAYKGSLMHFIRSLFADTAKKEGFKVDNMERIRLRDYYVSEVATIDTLFYNNKQIETFYNSIAKENPHLARRFLERVTHWKKDSTQTENLKFSSIGVEDGLIKSKTYELEKDELNPEKITTIVYPTDPEIEKRAKNGYINVITKEDVATYQFLTSVSFDNKGKELLLPSTWQVTYLKENEEKAYQEKQLGFKNFQKKYQVSLISKHPSGLEEIVLFEDGNHVPNSILIEGYWSYEKMDKMLPLDYEAGKH